MNHPTGYLSTCIKFDVDEVLIRIGSIPTQDRSEIHEFIDDMFATDRTPFHCVLESGNSIGVRAIFGGISDCSWAMPEPEEYFSARGKPFDSDPMTWNPSERLRLVSHAVALTLSSYHTGAEASGTTDPVDGFIRMLDIAKGTSNGFACLASLYAMGRLQTDRAYTSYPSNRRRESLRILAIDATATVLAAMLLNRSSELDIALVEAIRQRLAHEWDRSIKPFC